MNTNFEHFSTVKREPDIKEEPMSVNGRMLPLKESSRDILMDFGMNRKKVIHLDESNSLLTECKKHVYSDPALSDLLSQSYLVFQEFTPKFNTWVDIDCENTLRDGTVVKVMFFPKEVETDGLNPGCIKRKRPNVDNDANPKQFHEDSIRKKSNLFNRCDEKRSDNVEKERNEVIHVDSKKKSEISHSFNTQCSGGKPVHHAVTPSPVVKKEQYSLLPKTIKAEVHDSPANQALLVEEKPLPPFPQKSTSKPEVSTRSVTWITSLSRGVMSERQDAPANRALLVEKKPPPTFSRKSTPKAEVCTRSITWITPVTKRGQPLRRAWARKNMERKWWNTVFSEVASFGLEGNRIKLFDNFYHFKEGYEVFWGFRSFDGPNIIAPLGCKEKGFKLGEVFENKVVTSMKDH